MEEMNGGWNVFENHRFSAFFANKLRRASMKNREKLRERELNFRLLSNAVILQEIERALWMRVLARFYMGQNRYTVTKKYNREYTSTEKCIESLHAPSERNNIVCVEWEIFFCFFFPPVHL